MNSYLKLKEALAILEEHLYPGAMEIHLLQKRLTCCKCDNATCELNGWVCKLYGPIPDQYLNLACDNWKLSNFPAIRNS